MNAFSKSLSLPSRRQTLTDILSIINQKYPDKFGYLRLGSVKISMEEKKANVVFLVPEDIYDYHIKSEDVTEIKEAVKEALGNTFSVYCRLEKIILTKENVASALSEYMSKNFPLIAANLDFTKLRITLGDHIDIAFSVQNNIRDYMQRVDFDKKIADFFFQKYATHLTLSFELTEDLAIAPSESRISSGRYGKSVSVSDKQLVMGKLSDLHAPAVHISTLKGEGEDVVCCGKISYLAFRTRDENKRGEYKKFFKHYYTFSISDTTGFLNVFLNTDDEYPLLQNGAEVVCKGRVNNRDESSNLSMYVKSIAICKIPFATIEEQTKPLDPPESYTVLFPQEYHEIVYDQLGFDFINKPDRRAVGSELAGIAVSVRSLKTERAFVPYEVAMCKIEHGKISEYMHTYLMVAFTEESERAAFANQKGITAPRLSSVIPDLIKFTAGHLIVGLNPTATLDLLNVTAKPLRYLFRNDVHIIQPSLLKGENVKKGDALEEAISIAHAYISE